MKHSTLRRLLRFIYTASLEYILTDASNQNKVISEVLAAARNLGLDQLVDLLLEPRVKSKNNNNNSNNSSTASSSEQLNRWVDLCSRKLALEMASFFEECQIQDSAPSKLCDVEFVAKDNTILRANKVLCEIRSPYYMKGLIDWKKDDEQSKSLIKLEGSKAE